MRVRCCIAMCCGALIGVAVFAAFVFVRPSDKVIPVGLVRDARGRLCTSSLTVLSSAPEELDAAIIAVLREEDTNAVVRLVNHYMVRPASTNELFAWAAIGSGMDCEFADCMWRFCVRHMHARFPLQKVRLDDVNGNLQRESVALLNKCIEYMNVSYSADDATKEKLYIDAKASGLSPHMLHSIERVGVAARTCPVAKGDPFETPMTSTGH